MDKYRAIRTDFFSLYKMKFIPSSDNDILDEMIIVGEIINQNIDETKTSVGKYYKMKDRAHKKTEQLNKKSKASG